MRDRSVVFCLINLLQSLLQQQLTITTMLYLLLILHLCKGNYNNLRKRQCPMQTADRG